MISKILKMVINFNDDKKKIRLGSDCSRLTFSFISEKAEVLIYPDLNRPILV